MLTLQSRKNTFEQQSASECPFKHRKNVLQIKNRAINSSKSDFPFMEIRNCNRFVSIVLVLPNKLRFIPCFRTQRRIMNLAKNAYQRYKQTSTTVKKPRPDQETGEQDSYTLFFFFPFLF